jgi:hypothetical protein
MRLGIIICRARIVSVRSIAHGVKRIHLPTKAVSICPCRFKHLLTSAITATSGKLNFMFYKVQKSSGCKNNNFFFNYWGMAFKNDINQHPDHSQNKRMTPNKLQYFQRSIKSVLQFVNSSNLHGFQQFSLIKYRIAQVSLKICKLLGVILRFFRYVVQKNNTIWAHV